MPPRHPLPEEEDVNASPSSPPNDDAGADGDPRSSVQEDGDKAAVSKGMNATVDDFASSSPSTPLLPPSSSKMSRGEGEDDDEDDDDDDEEEDVDVDGDDKDECLRRCHFSLRYHLSLIFRLTPKLLRFLLCGTPRWLFKLIRLIMFVMCLLPAFVRFAWYYWGSSDRVVVSYKCVSVDGQKGTSRHLADVYGRCTPAPTPAENGADGDEADQPPSPQKPVVIFLTGGAWIIGYKMWGALLARALVPFGVLVIIPDYRNFPQTNVAGMVSDVDESIQWTLNNCRKYGGDPDRVVLVGQSAGAHLGSCVLTIKCLLELDPAARAFYPLATTYSPTSIRGFIPMSGPYDLIQMIPHLHKHGLDQNLLKAIFGGSKLERYSPVHIAKKCKVAQKKNRKSKGKDEEEVTMRELLPPTRLIHGTIDKTVPCRECEDFASVLRSACSGNASTATADADADAPAPQRISTLLYEGWSHTDPILEGPMIGDQRFHKEVYDRLKEWTGGNEAGMGEFDDEHPVCRPMCPRVLVWLGRIFNPF